MSESGLPPVEELARVLADDGWLGHDEGLTGDDLDLISRAVL